MGRCTKLAFLPLALMWGSSALAANIDDFETGPFFIADTTTPPPFPGDPWVYDYQAPLPPWQVWGSQRWTLVSLESGSGSVTATLVTTGADDAVQFQVGEGATGAGLVSYQVDTPLDLTEGGTRDHVIVEVDEAPSTGAVLYVTLGYDFFGEFVQYPVGRDLAGPGQYVFPFSEFGDPFGLTNVENIIVGFFQETALSPATDYAISRVYTTDEEGDRCALSGPVLATSELAGQADFTVDLITGIPNAAGTTLVILEGTTPLYAAAVQFDLSSIPTGSLIGAVEFEADVTAIGGAAWPEAFLQAGFGGVAPSFADWQNGEVRDMVGPIGFDLGSPWVFTEPLRCWLQGEVDAGAQWVALGFGYAEDPPGSNLREFASSRNSNSAARPALRIELLPEPSFLSGLFAGLALLGLLNHGRRRRGP
jgi:hypothetical protein